MLSFSTADLSLIRIRSERYTCRICQRNTLFQPPISHFPTRPTQATPTLPRHHHPKHHSPKSPRSLSNLNRQSMINIKHPPIRTSDQSLSFSLRTAAYEIISATLSTDARNDPSLFSFCEASTEEYQRLTHSPITRPNIR
jgi:hypothetical protein